MKIIYVICLFLIGCASQEAPHQCTKENYDSIGCQSSRLNANSTTFLSSILFYKINQIQISNENSLNEVIKFQKLYNAEIHILASSIDENKNTQNKRLEKITGFLAKNNLPKSKLKVKIKNHIIYRNGKKNKKLSRRVEIYIKY
ncbi:MAG: hypothetical protein ACTSXL_05255 [Alphaproteobacteria bacterium]|nr:MAG: hypothetical protein B6I23_01380 [Rickettsiaceae bacterium 4572_127]